MHFSFSYDDKRSRRYGVRWGTSQWATIIVCHCMVIFYYMPQPDKRPLKTNQQHTYLQCSNCQKVRWGLTKEFYQFCLYFNWNSGLEGWGFNPQPPVNSNSAYLYNSLSFLSQSVSTFYKIFWFTRSFHSICPIIPWQKGFLCHWLIGPRLWNLLPPDTWNSSSLPIFHSKLKTHLFKIAFPP